MSAQPASSRPTGPPPSRSRAGRAAAFLCLMPAALPLAGCRQAMYDQPRYEAYEASTFFEDGSSARPLIPGTVARGQLRDDDHRYTGKVDGKEVTTFPEPVTAKTLERGRRRYMIFCSPCHGAVGDGKGMIVQRGLSAPPSFHSDELRDMPVGHYFDVITNGYGAMYPYGYRVETDDRWAIIAYVRALQLSQRAELAALPAGLRREVERQAEARARAAAETKAAASAEGEQPGESAR